jgi:uncharacterized protein
MNYTFRLVILCIVVHIASLFNREFFISYFALVSDSVFIMPWMFVSALFMHGDVMHLIFNMVSLGIFGTILEHVIGKKQFLLVFFGTGILANLISFSFYPVALGASGAILGVLGTLAVMRPTLIFYVYFIPMPLWLVAIVYAVIDIFGVFFPSNVGNIAHLSGLVVGVSLGFYYRFHVFKSTFRKRRESVIDLDKDSYSDMGMDVEDWEKQYLKK